MPQQDAVPGIGDTVADKYQVVGLLGTGGMGAVLEAAHVITGKRFAIKWLLPNASASTVGVQRFVREAQVAGRVQHTNIVEVYDIGRQGNSSYMVMELLHGQPLQNFLAEEGRLSVREAIDLMLPILRGVVAAHRAGVIHRDLKPDNIFLSDPPPGTEGPRIPKILDFGISKLTEQSGPSPALTHAGAVMGTPYYMAPEQMRGDDVDHRVDVYALGVILYQMVTGQLPYEADSFPDLVVKVTTQEPPPLESLCPDLPLGFSALVMKTMAKKRDTRTPSVEALQSELLHYATPSQQDRSISMAPRPPRTTATTPLALDTPLSLATPRPRYGGERSRRTNSSLIGVGVVLVAAVGVLYFAWPQKPSGNVAAATSAESIPRQPVLPPSTGAQLPAAQPSAAPAQPSAPALAAAPPSTATTGIPAAAPATAPTASTPTQAAPSDVPDRHNPAADPKAVAAASPARGERPRPAHTPTNHEQAVSEELRQLLESTRLPDPQEDAERAVEEVEDARSDHASAPELDPQDEEFEPSEAANDGPDEGIAPGRPGDGEPSESEDDELPEERTPPASDNRSGVDLDLNEFL